MDHELILSMDDLDISDSGCKVRARGGSIDSFGSSSSGFSSDGSSLNSEEDMSIDEDVEMC